MGDVRNAKKNFKKQSGTDDVPTEMMFKCVTFHLATGIAVLCLCFSGESATAGSVPVGWTSAVTARGGGGGCFRIGQLFLECVEHKLIPERWLAFVQGMPGDAAALWNTIHHCPNRG